VLPRFFTSLHYRDFRLLWIGAFASSVGTWLQFTAHGWLVYSLSHSAFLLGLDGFLGVIPILLFSLVGGVIADRIDRRHVLLRSQYVQMACAFVLALLIALNILGHHVWPVLGLSFVVGCAQAFGGPAYQALFPNLVETEDLLNAIALNSIQFDMARGIASAVASMALPRLGFAWCLGLNGLSFVPVIISLLLLTVKFVPRSTNESIATGMQLGITFIRGHSAMAPLIALAFCTTALAIPTITFMPVFVKDVLHRGPEVFTVLLSCAGVGSVAGTLIVAGIGNIARKGRAALLMLLLLGGSFGGFALSKSLLLSGALVFVSSAATIGLFSMINLLVQLSTAEQMRGRVMSVYYIAFRSGMPLGNLAVGWLIPMYSAPIVLAVDGLLLVVLGSYVFLAQPRVAAL